MANARAGWWNALVDRWVRAKSRGLDNAALLPRKLLHTTLIAAVWPILHLQRPIVAAVLLGSCLAVILTQRRVPYASLALLTLLAFARILAVGGAWAVFTAGDGLSAIVGRALGGPTLPWNPRKTWTGSLTFLVAAGAALSVVLRLAQSPLGWERILSLAFSASLAGAIVESLDVRLDDNYSVIVIAGLVLQALTA